MVLIILDFLMHFLILYFSTDITAGLQCLLFQEKMKQKLVC